MPSTSFLDVFGLLTDLLVIAVVLTGLAVSLRRSAAPSQVRTGATITVMVLAWYGVSTYLAAHDVFRASKAVTVPAIPFAVFLPIIAGLWLIFRSRIMAHIIDATPLSWLIGVQVYRVVGVIFLILLGAGQLPPEFALPAGSGDLLVGLLALPVAWVVHTGSKRALTAAYVWNALGILDLVVALATGFLTSPGPVQLLALDHPNLIASAYPLVMIPVFLVPLSLILHGLCVWKLRRVSSAGVRDGESMPSVSSSAPRRRRHCAPRLTGRALWHSTVAVRRSSQAVHVSQRT